MMMMMTTERRALRPRRRPVWIVAPLAVLAVVLGACGGNGDDAADGAGDGNGGRGTDTVVLVTYDSFALSDEAAAAFTEETGATIEVVAAGDSGSMLTRALLSAGDPEGDVIFGIDNTMASRALDADLLEPVAGPIASTVPERFRLEGDAGERLVPIDTGDVCVNYDTQWFDEQGVEPPVTFEDLADPQWKDLTVLQSPVTSSPGMAMLIGTIDHFGEDGWEDYWQRLRDNGVRVRPSWDDAYYSDYTVSGGDRPIVLSYASSPPVEVIFSEDDLDEPRSAVALETCTAQIEYAGVLRGAANPDLAEELLRFMVSEDWQRELPMSNFVFPVTDVELPEVFERFAPRAEDPANLPAETIESRRDAWIEQWRNVME